MFNRQIRTWGFGKLGGTAGETVVKWWWEESAGEENDWESDLCKLFNKGEWSFSNWERELGVELCNRETVLLGTTGEIELDWVELLIEVLLGEW